MWSRATRLVLVGGASALAALACQNDIPALDVPGFLGTRAECPHAWIWPDDSSQHHTGLHSALIGNVSLVREIINVPEFHDCQRFLVPEAQRMGYDQFYAIWASSRLARLILDLTDSSTTGRLDTVGYLPPSVGGATPLTEAPPVAAPVASGFAVAVAEIYAEGRYPPLGIEPWLNCLYLFRVGGRWEARMVPAGHTGVTCARIALNSPTAIPAGTDLEVRDMSFPDFRRESDYPPVARWDWDKTNGQQYIGIKCGAAWCEIGAQRFISSAPIPVAASEPRGTRRVRLIKGWYDQQYLADESPGKMQPTGILGTIIPDSLLSRRDQLADFDGFVHSADVVLEKSSDADNAALGKYRAKFGFSEATFAMPNQVFLCHGARCTPRGTETAASCAAGVDWRTRIIAAIPQIPQTSVLKCIRRREAADYFVGPAAAPVILVPGTTRWRWLSRDEGSWSRCMYGCCSSEI